MPRKIHQPNQFLMLAIGLYFCYLIANMTGNLIRYCFTLLFYLLDFYPLNTGVLIGSLYQIILIGFLLFVLLKIHDDKLVIPSKFFDASFHKKLLVGIIVLFILNAVFNYQYDQVVDYLVKNVLFTHKPFSNVGEKLIYLDIIISAPELVKRIILLVLYFVLIRKELNKNRETQLLDGER